VYLFNKLVRSTLWRTVSAASKVKLTNALASGDADAVVDVLSKMGRGVGGPAAVSFSADFLIALSGYTLLAKTSVISNPGLLRPVMAGS
jgi:hypothetical protein